MRSFQKLIHDLDLVLPSPSVPVANYVPYVAIGNTVYVSGQINMDSGQPTLQGKVGIEVTSDQARIAARQAALNVIAIMSVACGGDVERVAQVIRIGVYVNCTPDFSEQPSIANGASDLFVAVFGDRGRHARTAIGTNALPFNVPVEVDAVFTMVS